MKYSEQEMAALISEVETQFADFLAKAETTNEERKLQKSEKTTEEVIETEEDEEVEQEMTKSEGELELDYDENDYVEMDKLYQSMSKAEQEAHYKSLKKSLFDDTSEEIEKTEKVKEEKLAKSEKEIALEEENAELKKNLEKLTVAFTNFLEQKRPPKRKAITKIEYIKKSEAEKTEEVKVDVSKLSKDEISQKLSEKIRSGSLKKDEKEAIDNYYLSIKPSIDSIKHLL